MMQTLKLKLIPQKIDERLDVCLTRLLPEFSRSRIQALIKAGNLKVQGKQLSSGDRLKGELDIELIVPDLEPAAPQPQKIKLKIIHEDKDIVVIDKQAGLVVHPAAGHQDGTLVNALLYHCSDLGGIGGVLRPGIVHRLDKDTSGVMIVAKNDEIMRCLMNQFKHGSVQKEYIALVRGIPRKKHERIETLIGRSSGDRKKMSAKVSNGKVAITDYEVIKSSPGGYSLLRLKIETGRTHQIRVHMAHIGHPVVGDAQYGGNHKGLNPKDWQEGTIDPQRQMLHAEKITFKHPRSAKILTFSAPIPKDMKDLMKLCGLTCPPKL